MIQKKETVVHSLIFIEAQQSQGSFWAGCMIPGSIYWQETEWPEKARGSVPPREQRWSSLMITASLSYSSKVPAAPTNWSAQLETGTGDYG